MTVNELAHAADVPPAKVRYYARRGLLPARREAGNGYRQFDNAALARLRFIATARVLGFALKDIERLLREADIGQSPCPQVRTLLDQRVTALTAQRRALVREEARLKGIAVRWADVPNGVPDERRLCPLIEVARGA